MYGQDTRSEGRLARPRRDGIIERREKQRSDSIKLDGLIGSDLRGRCGEIRSKG